MPKLACLPEQQARQQYQTRDIKYMNTDSPIDTVLFDFDGTLAFHRPDSFDVISAFCADIGQPLSAEAERRGRRMRHEYFLDPVIRDQLAGLSTGEFWHHFNRHTLEAFEIQGDLDRLAADVTGRFDGLELEYYCPEPGCRTLTELGARGYHLGLLTNRLNVERLHELVEQLELQDYFDLILASGEVGIQKPDPGIFAIALERMGASASASLYVGDNYWADVVGAQRAGLIPVLFDPHHLFPEADCQLLERIEDLLDWLPGHE
jgi:HAD superfamily hydrolase (TIGR01549 family)